MPEESAQRILDLLDHALPAPRRGTRVLDRALSRAGLDAMPVTTEELKAFVRITVRAVLEEELGARLANEVTNDLDAALTPALRRCETWPASPSSRRLKRISQPSSIRVLVVGGDRLRNASVARTLLGDGYAVSTAHDVAEIALASALAAPDAIVLDERCALDPPDALLPLLSRKIAVVHNCSNPPLAESIVRSHGVTRCEAIRSGSPTRDLLRALTSLIGSLAAS